MLFNPIENVWKYNYFSVIQSVALPVQELVAGEVDDTVRGEVSCKCKCKCKHCAHENNIYKRRLLASSLLTLDTQTHRSSLLMCAELFTLVYPLVYSCNI